MKKNDGDEDLSGCLASGFLGKYPDRGAKTTARQQPANDNSGDLSGCLASGFLQPKRVATKTIQTSAPIAKPKIEPIEIDEDPGSDWFYLN